MVLPYHASQPYSIGRNLDTFSSGRYRSSSYSALGERDYQRLGDPQRGLPNPLMRTDEYDPQRLLADRHGRADTYNGSNFETGGLTPSLAAYHETKRSAFNLRYQLPTTALCKRCGRMRRAFAKCEKCGSL